ncbi:MAG: hypothetical protein VYD81_06455 [Planctomycetota bacterium]|nr:hypothetical protein [Planctomycetota bacterium]
MTTPHLSNCNLGAVKPAATRVGESTSEIYLANDSSFICYGPL